MPSEEKEGRAEAVRRILDSLESKELKATLGDYIRLLQLEREMGPETPSKVLAGWVEPKKSPDP